MKIFSQSHFCLLLWLSSCFLQTPTWQKNANSFLPSLQHPALVIANKSFASCLCESSSYTTANFNNGKSRNNGTPSGAKRLRRKGLVFLRVVTVFLALVCQVRAAQCQSRRLATFTGGPQERFLGPACRNCHPATSQTPRQHSKTFLHDLTHKQVLH